jgi:hypothetical protein
MDQFDRWNILRAVRMMVGSYWQPDPANVISVWYNCYRCEIWKTFTARAPEYCNTRHLDGLYCDEHIIRSWRNTSVTTADKTTAGPFDWFSGERRRYIHRNEPDKWRVRYPRSAPRATCHGSPNWNKCALLLHKLLIRWFTTRGSHAERRSYCLRPDNMRHVVRWRILGLWNESIWTPKVKSVELKESHGSRYGSEMRQTWLICSIQVEKMRHSAKPSRFYSFLFAIKQGPVMYGLIQLQAMLLRHRDNWMLSTGHNLLSST